MARQLKTFVHVIQEDGSSNVYGPGDDIPKADAEKIGDHCWEGEDEGDKPAARRRSSSD